MPPALPDITGWQALCAQAAEPSVMACPPFTRAALAHLPPGKRPWLHVLPGRGDTPLAVAPLFDDGWRWRPAGRIISNRWGDFFMLGTPLLTGEDTAAAWRQLLQALRREGFAALELRTLPADGAMLQALRQALAEHGQQPVELARWQRAVLNADRSPEEWWRQDVTKKRRKEWSRLKRKLQQQGELVFETLPTDAPATELSAWMDDFLQLEAAGWKGRAGTALACTAHDAAFARDMTTGFHAQGNLRFWRLRLDGRTIASLFAMAQGAHLWLGKIAYDESLAAFSPGVLLMIEATRAILAEPGIAFADSCADPNHPMIDHIWKQRLELVDVLAPLPGTSQVRFATLLAMERGYRSAREAAKRLWHRLRRHK